MADVCDVDPFRRDLPAAARAVGKLLANGRDTAQVFRILEALNGPCTPKNYHRLLRTPAGRRLAYRRSELVERLSDPSFIAGLGAGTVGAAYRSFIGATGYSAAGLAEISSLGRAPIVEDAYLWLRRRTRDVHDLWHVLTGYRANEDLGETALVAFSYAQTGGKGWAVIALAATLQSLRLTGRMEFAQIVLEGYRLGRRATWLLGEDDEALLHEPLEAARQRLGIGTPVRYLRCSPSRT